MSHETKDPQKNIPRAVLLTTLLGGGIFISASWFIQLYFPSNVRFNNPDEALPEIVLYVGGALFQAVFLCAQIMNTFASGLATHASASRLIHIMAKDGIFPKATFGQLHAKLGTPLYAVLSIFLVTVRHNHWSQSLLYRRNQLVLGQSGITPKRLKLLRPLGRPHRGSDLWYQNVHRPISRH